VQEKLTQEIFNKLKELLNTDDIAIEITAEHFCVKLRGIKDQNSKTITRKLGGAFFNDDKLRNEFLTKN
jgi:GTP cyclohydrolase I